MAVGWLLIPPPPSYKPLVPHRVISPNADCPICGNASGKIECIPLFEEGTPGLTVRHTCNICGGAWFELPVVKDDPSRLRPSLDSLS